MFEEIVQAIKDSGRTEPRVMQAYPYAGKNLIDPGNGDKPYFEDVPVDCRTYKATSIAGIIDQVEYLNKNKSEGQKTAVFVGETITVVLDEAGDRRDTVRFPMTISEQFAALKAMHDQPRVESQADMVWKLVSLFRDNIVEETFLPTIRHLKWSSSNGAKSAVHHGAESLGSDVESQVSRGDGASDKSLPDQVTFEVPVFTLVDADVPYNVRVRCAVRFSTTDNRGILIRPEPGQLEHGRARAIASIAAELKEKLPDDVAVLGQSVFG